VRTVNHRFFNSSIKGPPGFDRFERDVTEVLRRHIARGHVSAHLFLDRRSAENGAGPRADLDKARQYRSALEAVQKELGVPGVVDLAMLSRFGELFRAQEPERVPDVEPELVRELADEAGLEVVALREAEGRRLREDLEGRVRAMAGQLAIVEVRAPERVVRERDRLRQAVRELSGQVEVDEDRLAREVAYLAERMDVNEEIVRLRSHLDLFREALAREGPEPVGKRLGFLVQEMHREVNTIGSKANDATIGEASMALKEEIERLREQVENVE
jgi:uncharacterized protein (TIGR00255 family)